MMKQVVYAIIFSLALAKASDAAALTSKEYAMSGKATWAAFTCSALAGYAKKGEEQRRRLFDVGLSKGELFLGAVKAKSITRADIDNNVPFIVLTLLYGPSNDFTLGMIYKTAMDEAGNDLKKRGVSFLDDEQLTREAGALFSQKNCPLL